MLALLGLQVLFVVTPAGSGPLRCGIPVPAAALPHGCARRAMAWLQWRPLQLRPDPHTGTLWIEVALDGPALRNERPPPVRVRAGGAGATAVGADGVVVRVEESQAQVDGVAEVRRTWHWRLGGSDTCVRRTVRGAGAAADALLATGVVREVGESWTEVSEHWAGRFLRAQIAVSMWRAAEVLPPRLAGIAATHRRHLAALGRALPMAAAPRDLGDFRRGGGDVVTNLEFDTTLAFLRLGLVEGDGELLRRGMAAARHLVDHDLDLRSGLPFAHGSDHRSSPPEVGHAWLDGLLLAGCLGAEDDWIAAAAGIARGLARHPPPPIERREDDRMRLLAWPLLACESRLRFAEDPAVAAAADAMRANLCQRFDADLCLFRFGEGARDGRDPSYFERAWITSGVLLPALRASLRRRDDPRLRRQVARVAARLDEEVRRGGRGMSVRFETSGTRVTRRTRLSKRGECFLMLEGLTAPQLVRSLQRAHVEAALSDAPHFGCIDVATQFSMAGRCARILR